MATTRDETLADEQRRRIPAGIVAVAAGILTLAGGVLTALIFSDRPDVPLAAALREHLAPASPQPGLKARQVLWDHDHALELIVRSIVLALAAAAIGLALTHLYRSIKARRPELPRAVVAAAITGAVTLAVSSLVQAIGGAMAAADFADSATQTAAAARDALAPSTLLPAAMLELIGRFAFAMAFLLLALNGMRVGLLTRFVGVLGMIVGALFILPVGASIPIVQAIWLVALGLLFLGRWPGGPPPAWVTGEAQPWPTQQEIREARMAARSDGAEAEGPRRAGRRERAEAPETPAPELPARRPHPSSKKRKHKRR